MTLEYRSIIKSDARSVGVRGLQRYFSRLGAILSGEALVNIGYFL